MEDKNQDQEQGSGGGQTGGQGGQSSEKPQTIAKPAEPNTNVTYETHSAKERDNETKKKGD